MPWHARNSLACPTLQVVSDVTFKSQKNSVECSRCDWEKKKKYAAKNKLPPPQKKRKEEQLHYGIKGEFICSPSIFSPAAARPDDRVSRSHRQDSTDSWWLTLLSLLISLITRGSHTHRVLNSQRKQIKWNMFFFSFYSFWRTKNHKYPERGTDQSLQRRPFLILMCQKLIGIYWQWVSEGGDILKVTSRLFESCRDFLYFPQRVLQMQLVAFRENKRHLLTLASRESDHFETVHLSLCIWNSVTVKRKQKAKRFLLTVQDACGQRPLQLALQLFTDNDL